MEELLDNRTLQVSFLPSPSRRRAEVGERRGLPRSDFYRREDVFRALCCLQLPPTLRCRWTATLQLDQLTGDARSRFVQRGTDHFALFYRNLASREPTIATTTKRTDVGEKLEPFPEGSWQL